MAVQAERAEAGVVAMLDTVPNGALAAWGAKRRDRSPSVASIGPDDLAAALAQYRKDGTAYVPIDTPAQADAELERVAALVDLVVVPTPRRHQHRGASLPLADAGIERAGKPFVFVVNQGNPKQPLTAATAMALAQHGTLCPVALARDSAFSRCLDAGEAVPDAAGDSPTATAVAELWSHLDSRITALAEKPEPVSRRRSFEDRRAFPRFELDWDVTLIRDGADSKCRLNDISGGGVSISSAEPLATGEQVSIDIPHFGRLDAKVMHVRGGRAGLAFLTDAQAQWLIAEKLSDIIGAARQDSREASQAPAHASSESRAQQPDVEIKTHTVATAPPHHGRIGEAANCRVIVVGNEKGGCGKSTVAMHLLVALLRDGHRVASIDLDARQGTLTRYIENRREFAASSGKPLPTVSKHVRWSGEAKSARLLVTRLAASADYLVIDTPGHDSPLTRAAYELADTVITPVNDSFVDLDVIAHIDAANLNLRAPGQFGEFVQHARQARENMTGGTVDWIVLRNRLSSLDARNKRDMADALAQLAPQLGFRAGPGLSERVIYRELFLHGLTLLDLRESGVGVKFTLSHVAARQELRALLDAVLTAPHTVASKAA